MSDPYGTIIDVSTINAGDNLTADAALGATSLFVSDVSVFNELGGKVYLDGAVYDYSVDPDLNNLLVSPGLVTAAVAGDRIEIYPPAPLRQALVDFGGDESEAVRVTIPHSMSALVSDGTREEANREVALIEERSPGELVIKDIATQALTLLAAAENLDVYTSQGVFIQLYSTDAATGSNYPVPYAGVLEVLATRPADVVIQRYTAYRTASDIHYPSGWHRSFGAGSWSDWKPLNPVDPVVADKAASATHTVTTTSTVIPGVTHTFTPPSLDASYLVLGTVDIASASAAGTVFVELYVDSTAKAEQILWGVANGRGTSAQQWIVSGLSVASHTLQLRADGTTGVTGHVIQNIHTTMKIIQLAY